MTPKTLSIIAASSIVAVGVSSTVLFPLIEDLNKTITNEKSEQIDASSKDDKIMQTIVVTSDKSQNSKSVLDLSENPSINQNTVDSEANIQASKQAEKNKLQLMESDIPL